MPTAILADDEPLMRAALRDHLHDLWPALQIVVEADDGPTALLKIETHRPDVAFLDIRMPGMTGLEVARAMTCRSLVVFVTAFESHAVEAFDTNALDYVLKPVEPAKLVKVIAKLERQLADGVPLGAERLLEALAKMGVEPPRQPMALAPPARDPRRLEWLQVASARGDQVSMIHLHDVLYFESDTKYTRVVTKDSSGLIRLSLKEVLEHADAAAFLQTHRSTVVNRRAIKSVHRNGETVEIELKDRPERLKVSAANHHLFRAM